MPQVTGPLQLSVVYPPVGALVDVRDSTFILGSTGTGDARLTINGEPVRVWPNGAWLAWVPFSGDSVVRFDLVARTATDSVLLTHVVRRPPRFVPPLLPVWIDSTSITPRGRIWIPRDEYVPVSVRAVDGAAVQIRLRGGATIALTPDRPPLGSIARYAGLVRGLALGPDPGPVIDPRRPATDSWAPSAIASTVASSVANVATTSVAATSVTGASGNATGDTAGVIVEAILGSDTARMRWPIRLAALDTVPTVVELDDDTLQLGNTDSLTVGRAAPGTTYHWFFPTGTRATVTGRINGDLRLRLSPGAEVWVPAADARALPSGMFNARATVGSVRLNSLADRVDIRVPVSGRVPFQVRESERGLALTLYGAVGDIDRIRYAADSLVQRVEWRQTAREEVTLEIELTAPVWGYRTRWAGSDLVLEVRRPPPIDEREPLRGRLIMLDPGHPPFGATGPTGLREATANLAAAFKLRDLLEGSGARVLLTRTTDTDVDLVTRVKLAEQVNADLLISIHSNALPDGINPFTNNGTTVFYNLPRSLPLAREIQRELLRRLGLPDLGVGWADLALVRETWMPAVLCEGLFMTLPEQEAALRSGEGQRLYALGIADGIRRFLRQRAKEQ